MSNEKLRISLLQHKPVPADTNAALERLEHYAKRSSENACQLLLVPEASITGYNIPKLTMQSVALNVDSEFTRRLKSICRENNIAIAYGFAERDGENFYNTVQLINRFGEIAGKYRKTHLWGNLDKTLFSPGVSLDCTPANQLAVIENFKIGLLICYDVEFPECARALALRGADLILVPTGLMQPWREVAEQVVPVRAYENQLFIAYANYCGSEGELQYEGRSCIVGPDGKDLTRAGQEPVLLTATLNKRDIKSQREALPYHRDRRPELYK